jgi:aminoglycoside 2'-N-acetyltransferase I
VLDVRRLLTEQIDAVELRSLFDDAFEGDFSDDDWEHTIGGVHVAVLEGGSILSHGSVVPRTIWIDDRPFAAGYVEGVATLARSQRKGLGSLVMSEIGQIIEETHELGVLSTGSPSFYQRLGWEMWEGPTWVRTPIGSVRTRDDDGGIMILRTSSTGDLLPGAAIACEERRGDDW